MRTDHEKVAPRLCEERSPEEWARRAQELGESDDAFLALWPWVDPYLYPYPHTNGKDRAMPYKEGVRLTTNHSVMAYRATHKTVPVLHGYLKHQGIENIGGLPWELFNCSMEGTVDGVDYLWGMPVLGMGLLDCCIPREWARELTPGEREHWAKAQLSMVGSHTGKVSVTGLSSGVAPPTQE